MDKIDLQDPTLTDDQRKYIVDECRNDIVSFAKVYGVRLYPYQEEIIKKLQQNGSKVVIQF